MAGFLPRRCPREPVAPSVAPGPATNANGDVAVNADVLAEQALDAAITDCCEFLAIDRQTYFELALAWDELGAALWPSHTPETFYTAWTGDAGRANLCRNLIDQFARRDVWAVLSQLTDGQDGWWLLDYGCGSAATALAVAPRCRQVVLVDVPNLAQEFVAWRIERHGLKQVSCLTPAEAEALPAESFDYLCCIDVLEHLPTPTTTFERLDALLRRAGCLLFRAPWARPDEDFSEHLPEATADWHRPGGGADRLATRYHQVLTISFGGLYVKR